MIFLSDYDMRLSEQLVQGVDVPDKHAAPTWEACGTSGMKVLVNGGINLSELDGWWAEAYTSEVGWAIGDRLEHGGDSVRRVPEAVALYERLEREVVPEFYTRDKDGVPAAWVARMRESMALLTPRFSAHRAVREYTGPTLTCRLLPPIICAATIKGQSAGKWSIGSTIWNRNRVALHFGEVKFETRDGQHVFEVQVFLNDLDPQAVRVELYANGVNDGPPVRQEMKRVRQLANSSGGYVYTATVSADRQPADYTARIIPHYDGVAVPLEVDPIVWQR